MLKPGKENKFMHTKTIAKRVLPLLFAAVTTLALASCAADKPSLPSANQTTEKWYDGDDATYSAESSDDDRSIELPSGVLRVGKTAAGKDIFTFMRSDLSATWLADEVGDARLFLKLKSETAPKQLKLSLLLGAWDGYTTTRQEAGALVDASSAVTAEVKAEAAGWISVPVTGFVKTWLSGEMQNNGFAVFAATNGDIYDFASTYDEAGTDMPYIAASGAAGDRPLVYGKFGYTETPLPDADDMGGNCMSYALRDTNMILGSDLGFDAAQAANVLQNADANQGVDALTDYVAERVIDYVEAHKDGLVISKFRQIDSFDSEIDPATEYRIALRLGLDKYSDGNPDFSGDHAFDYHFWLQLGDGRWAQKYPTGESLIVPCTAHDIDPGTYPWSAGYNWSEKNKDYYTSKTVYFAVTKDTDEITQHRGEIRDRNYDESSDISEP
jgi:hypothetical protein